MRNKILENRVLKIWGIVLCIVAGYVMFHHVTDEAHFQRYPSIFAAFIEMYLNDHTSLDYFNFMPLFSSDIQTDPLLSSMAEKIMGTESYFPNFAILFLILHYVIGLSSQVLVVLPLGVLFMPIAYFAIIKTYVPIKDGSDFIYHTLLGIYFMLYLAITKIYGSFYVAPSAYLLIITFFLCLRKFYEKVKNVSYYLIICLSILSLAHYWHSGLMIELCFIASLFIFSGIFYLFNTKQNFFQRSLSLFIISVVVSITFMHLWQSPYIGDFFRTANLYDYISKALTKLMGGNPYIVPYAFNYKDLFWGKIYFISILSIYILSTLILVLSLLPHIFISKKARKEIGISLPLIFVLALIFAQILNSFLYYRSGSIGFPFSPLIFPIFGISLIVSDEKRNFRKVIISILSLMIAFSLLSNIALYVSDDVGASSVTKYKDTEISFEWLYNKMNRSRNVVIDFNILGKYLQREAKKSKPSIEYEHISSNSYGVLIGDTEITDGLTKNYAVIDRATMSKGLPIHSYGSKALLEPKWIQIDNCENQDKIYEDNNVSIFIFK